MSHVPNEKSILRTARRRVNAFGAAFDERIRSALAVVYKWKSSKFRSADTPRLTDHRAWELHVLLSAFVLCACDLSRIHRLAYSRRTNPCGGRHDSDRRGRECNKRIDPALRGWLRARRGSGVFRKGRLSAHQRPFASTRSNVP